MPNALYIAGPARGSAAPTTALITAFAAVALAANSVKASTTYVNVQTKVTSNPIPKNALPMIGTIQWTAYLAAIELQVSVCSRETVEDIGELLTQLDQSETYPSRTWKDR